MQLRGFQFVKSCGIILCAAGLAFFTVAGCSKRPRAPALEAGPVFQNKQEGIRFRVPDSWVQSARGELPSGKLEKERLMVSYRSKDRVAAFELNALDFTDDLNLSTYLAERAYGSNQWKPAGPPEDVKIGDLNGVRYVMSGRIDKEPMTLDVVSVHRGDRVYLFKGIYASKDKAAREQLREAVHSIIMRAQ
jgi:hypothetical protein